MAELPKGGGGGKGQSKELPAAPSKEALDAAIQKAQKNGTHVKNTALSAMPAMPGLSPMLPTSAPTMADPSMLLGLLGGGTFRACRDEAAHGFQPGLMIDRTPAAGQNFLFPGLPERTQPISADALKPNHTSVKLEQSADAGGDDDGEKQSEQSFPSVAHSNDPPPAKRRKLVSRRGPKERGFERERVWPSGESRVPATSSTSTRADAGISPLVVVPHQPDGRCCCLCPCKDSDPDSVNPKNKMRWMKPYSKQTGKSVGNCCYYCYVNFRARKLPKGEDLRQAARAAGMDSKQHQENQDYRAKIVEEKLKEYQDFLALGGEDKEWDEQELTAKMKELMPKGHRTRFESFTADREKTLEKDRGFNIELSKKDAWYDLQDYLPEYGDPRINGLGHTIVELFGQIGIIVKRGGPTGEISRNQWEGFNLKEQVMGKQDEVEDGDCNRALANLEKDYFAQKEHRPTGYSMDAICGGRGQLAGLTGLPSIRLLGPPNAGAQPASVAPAGFPSDGAADDESAIFKSTVSRGPVNVGEHPITKLQPYGTTGGQETPAEKKAGKGEEKAVKGKRKRGAVSAGDSKAADLQPLADAASVAGVGSDGAGGGGGKPVNPHPKAKAARGRPKKDPLVMANGFIRDYENAASKADNIFEGQEWKTTEKGVESSLQGLREALENKDLGKEEIEKLNIAEKRLDAVDKLSKALRKHGLQREFFTTLGAMGHFLAAPPVAKMNTPSFIVQKRVEHICERIWAGRRQTRECSRAKRVRVGGHSRSGA